MANHASHKVIESYFEEYWTSNISLIREQIFSSWDRDCYYGSGIRIVNCDGIRKSVYVGPEIMCSSLR